MSKEAKSYESVKVYEGVYVYLDKSSPYWKLRVHDPVTKRMRVKSTKEKTRAKAIEAARELASDLISAPKQVDQYKTIKHFAHRLTEMQNDKVRANELSAATAYNDELRLFRSGGIVDVMGSYDVTEITPQEIAKLFSGVAANVSNGSPADSTYNQLLICMKKMFGVAVEDGVIRDIPQLPKQRRSRRRQQPRPAFDFSDMNNEWEKLQKFSRKNVGKTYRLPKGKKEFQNIELTQDFYDLLQMLLNTFLRPTVSEMFAVQHKHIQIKDNPKRITLRIIDGKTGARFVDSLPAAVSAYERILHRNGNNPDDFILFPQYKNRKTAQKNAALMMKSVLADTGLSLDEYGNQRTLYSIRHTAIQMRLVKSKGKVNIFALAKNAGTSVEMIESFYAKSLPNSDEIAANLQTFGD